MGVLIRLPDRPARPFEPPREGSPAAILFFTGVRYERQNADRPEGNAPPRDGSAPEGARARRRRRG